MYTSQLSRTLITASKIYPHQAPFSFLAWQRIRPIYNQITQHPFNQELAFGTLLRQRFLNYVSQDAFYLDVYHETLKQLARKLQSSGDKMVVEQLAVGSLAEKDPTIYVSSPTRATLNYTNFLRQVTLQGSGAEIAAAVLPCFWIYYELANALRNTAQRTNNPYLPWLERYSGDKFGLQVNFMKQLTNRLAAQNPAFIQAKMFHHFQTASQMEYEFWNSAYTNYTPAFEAAK